MKTLLTLITLIVFSIQPVFAGGYYNGYYYNNCNNGCGNCYNKCCEDNSWLVPAVGFGTILLIATIHTIFQKDYPTPVQTGHWEKTQIWVEPQTQRNWLKHTSIELVMSGYKATLKKFHKLKATGKVGMSGYPNKGGKMSNLTEDIKSKRGQVFTLDIFFVDEN